MPNVEPPLDNQGAPKGDPGPEALMYLRVPPYCWLPVGLEAAVEEGTGLVTAGLVVVTAGLVVTGTVAAGVVADWLVTAGVVTDGVVEAPLLQAVMRMEIKRRNPKRSNSFFIYSSY